MKKIFCAIFSTTIGLIPLFTGCDENNKDKEKLALILLVSESMGCYAQGDCHCQPSVFIKSPIIDAVSCTGLWTVRPLIDTVCGTAIDTTVRVGDTTTTTYKTNGCP